MKKFTLLTLAGLSALCTQAQVETDTVSIGAGYSNQAWYSLLNGVQATVPQNNWDLAFDASMMGATITINSANGTMVWKYPNADTSGWNSIDTTGLSTWAPHWNGEQYWGMGAIGMYPDPADPYSVDWGVYNPSNHSITGVSLYIIKLANGDYKKLWIQSLTGSTYKFKYADLDGNNAVTATLNKASFPGRNLCYYSLQSNASKNREPNTEDWDLLFTNYTALFPIPHTEAGVLTNAKVQTAKCSSVDVATFDNYQGADYLDSINTIGHSWKTGSGSNYTMQDSLLYFVSIDGGDIWKVVFKAFGGDANGDYIFTKENLTTTTTVSNTPAATTASMALYPNPASGQQCSVVYNFKNITNSATIVVNDITGKLIYTAKLPATSGMQLYRLPMAQFTTGTYTVTILANGVTGLQQRLVVQ